MLEKALFLGILKIVENIKPWANYAHVWAKIYQAFRRGGALEDTF